MDIRISPDAVVSDDRSFVVFDAYVGERSVQCSVAREALKHYFWALVGASDAQLPKSYIDGRKRIEAMVCRKFLATPGETIGLNMSDFARRTGSKLTFGYLKRCQFTYAFCPHNCNWHFAS
jgi:hypothetical protein